MLLFRMINIIASQSCRCWQNWFFHLRSAQPWYYRGCRVCKMENFPKKHLIGNDSVYKSNGNDTEKVRYLTPVLTPPLPTAAFTNSSLTTYSSFFVCLKTYGSLFETEIILCKGLTRCICLKCVCLFLYLFAINQFLGIWVRCSEIHIFRIFCLLPFSIFLKNEILKFKT